MGISDKDWSAEFRGCLQTLDLNRARKLWAHVFAHLPPPGTDEELEQQLHLARTQTRSLTLNERAYSHRWLTERMLPTGLPDHERASAERMYPAPARAVGISLNTRNEIIKPILVHVREAMEYMVHDAFAEGKADDSNFIRNRMNEAKNQTLRTLLGVRVTD